jgi:[protein-PII] uridylyltransferase
MIEELIGARAAAAATRELSGRAYCEVLSRSTDSWLTALFDRACAEMGLGADPKVALVALGGYGRGLLAPASDLDLALVHDMKHGVDELAQRIWYPIWDAGLKLGHGVFTLKEASKLAAAELDAATSQLSARLLAGDARLASELAKNATANWSKRSGPWLAALRVRVESRQAEAGEVAFLLEPDVKEGRGGLRDIHALQWAEGLGVPLEELDAAGLREAEDVLLTVRVALHQVTGRPGNVLRLEDQDAVAAATRYRDADSLMAAVSGAGRFVAWVADEAWSREERAADSSAPRIVAPGVMVHHHEVHLAPDEDPAHDPTIIFQLATAAARLGVPIARTTLERLANELPPFPDPWPAMASDELIGLLLEGHRAIRPIESLDQLDLVARVLPEWESVRNKPQRNAFHRFTVDRHLLETVANAADRAERVNRPDLLVIGALLHDIGKGRPGDHTDNGIEMSEVICRRMGFNEEDTATVVAMVRYHLLLPDVAVRRDIADDATITSVAELAGTRLVLDLLHALTEADSLATGMSAWGSWKAELVKKLHERAAHVLSGGDVREVTWRLFPSAEILGLMATGEVHVLPGDGKVTTVAPDRAGLFSRVAGVLTLHGLDVLAAEAHSDEHGMAANELRVQIPKQGVDWARVTEDVVRALHGQLALEARLAERARTYRRRRRQAAAVEKNMVRFDNDASSNATVLEVRVPNRVGVLYGITKALAELGLDLRHAKVQSMGDTVFDCFYVRGAQGKITDPFHQREIERAVLHAVG